MSRIRIAALLLPLIGSAARADFVPGRLYVSGSAGPCEEAPNQAVFEFDPVTRESRMFAQLPDDICGFMTGLAFTPDGSRLRASVWDSSSIVEIDGDGDISVAYDLNDGIVGPYGSNNLVYDDDGDFYVVNSGADQILRFPQDVGPPHIFATPAEGVTFAGPLARAADNALYYAREGFRQEIFRIAGPGQSQIFDTLPGTMTVASMVSDADGNLFVLANRAIFRYENGDPSTRRQLTNFGGTPGITGITISPDGTMLLAALGSGLYSFDSNSGASTFLGTVTSETHEGAGGIAVAIPEPTAAVMLGLAIFVLRSRIRRCIHPNSIASRSMS